MSGPSMTLRAALALMVLNAALSGVVWHGYAEAEPGAPDTESAAETPVVLASSGRDTGSATAESWASVTLARPVFDPRRRPTASDSQPVAAGLPRLTGVLIGPGERLAFFLDPVLNKPQVLREGDTIGAHMVQAIRPGEAVVTGPGGQQVLRPSFERSGTGTVP
ncbi:hypothetical protein [Belnapia rosea]|uniref:hypothetical protein n=1 Tax=Belnapia rosea TaxID=938405 RepID=UPI0015A06872|nr:hypothetical protein [Belnapia rosea]